LTVLDPGDAAGRATENENRRRRAPRAPDSVPAAAERNLAVTDTCSPAANGRAGEKAVPCPAGCALNLPAWTPLREPTTLTAASSPGATAGNTTFVPGAASGVPGNGNTSSPCETELGAAFEERAVAGARPLTHNARPAAPTAADAHAAASRRGRHRPLAVNLDMNTPRPPL
jgi:hypothetical protein